MFKMDEHAGHNAGYQIRITYKRDTNQYYVMGFVMLNDMHNYKLDGGIRVFNTLEDAIGFITHYGE